ncbi:hypothetical protein HBZC1_10010 [Helicobacter bizzozeronii CIII-1]|uniref:beta-lactamase n=1 Tax=Helicobacter bizzozeronii (strain CIII-1) TaxID=1002804 RepID=F8KT42_HELBC|nr:hypothetical protein HBZC1_10010 [Helicobacter bizzozeronii CIII-1]
MHYAPQSADWQKVQEAVESCHSPALKNYNTQRSKFQKAFDVLCQHLEPLLKDTPKFSTTEELQCWFVLVELERGRCLKAWKAFYKVYKEECKAKGESKLSHSDMSEATESVYNVFVDSLDTLRERVDDFLECADRLSGVHLLAQIPFRILWDEEEDLSMLLEMREAVGAVVSTDAKVCEAKKAVELKIAQCQEELPKCLALLEQAKDKSLKERNTIKKPFKKLQESLETDIQTLFEASDESLGVAVVRRVRGIKKTEFAHNYDQSGFKNALEKEVLKPLEEHFKALGLVVEPKRALGMLQAKMQENIATIPEALLELDKTYQELEKEGIATDKELRTIRKSVEPFLESFEESLQAFVKSTRDKAIIAAGKRILKGLEEAWLSGLEEILPDLEAFMQVAGKSLHGSTASMDAEQMRAFVTERLHAELKRNNVCEHLGNLEVSLKPLQEKAQELQTAIHQNKEDNITPYINGFQQAHQDTLKELKHLLELLDHNTSKELTALSAELDVLDKDLRFQREDYQQESSRQKDYQEDEDLEDTLKILKKAFRQGILKVLEALEAKMPKLHTALENLKTSPFFKALIKPLWFYQGDNFKAYADYLEASQKNNAQAYLELGKMFLKGVVVSSLEKAREHFKKAATLGSIRAITQLGLSYVPENPKEMKEEDAKKATDYLKKALLLGDGMAEAGLKRLSYFDVIEWDGHRDGLIDLVSDVEAMLFSKEVEGERAYVCFFEASAHIDEHDGIDPEYREYSIQPFFEGDGFEDTGLFDEGFCATMQGHNARLHLSILKTIDVVYGKPTKNDYEVAYSDAKEAYLKGIALGSGCCALELAHLELEQLKHFKMKPEKKQNALLEANHRAIGYFKQALEWGYNIAKVPLTDTLDKQKNLLAKASDHPLHAFLAKYESDLKEVASLTFTDKSMGFGGKLDIKAHLSPTFWQHPALKTLEVKTEQKPVSTLKPLWQYGNNTQQAFRDYMEAKKKGDARAWLYLGVMCLQGVVVPPDYYTAVACFEKARDLGELL